MSFKYLAGYVAPGWGRTLPTASAAEKIGVIATIVIIATNVIHNVAVTARRIPEGGFLELAAANPLLDSQIVFLLFVAATTHLAWRSGAQG